VEIQALNHISQTTPSQAEETTSIEGVKEGYVSESGVSKTKTNNQHPREIADHTVEQYIGFVKTLRKKWMCEQDNPSLQDARPIDLAEYLISHASEFRPKTFIAYRCGLLYWLNTLPDSSDVHHARLQLEVGIPRHGFKGPKRKQESPTVTLYSYKSNRPRTFRRREFERLIADLQRRALTKNETHAPSRATQLLLWLRAGLATGLRPCEWEKARWQDQAQGKLLVLTAKRKLGTYALPAIAHLPVQKESTRIVTINPEDIDWVSKHMQCVRTHLLTQEPFRTYYNNNRIYLWSVCKELFGDSRPPFTLYMMRGQFAANRKKSGQPPQDLASEMGCSVNKTQACYGRKHAGHTAPIKDSMPQKEQQTPTQANNGKFRFQRTPIKAGSTTGTSRAP